MLSRQHFPLRIFATYTIVAALFLSSAPLVSAQEEKQSSAFADIVKGVVFDPTTYAPAVIGYDATMRDWKTSQPFFRNGYVEHNARFTVSGRPDDRAVSYAAGRQLILKDAFAAFGVAAAQNLSSRLVERALLERYPQRTKLIKTLGWVQRIAIASAMSYHLSASHYRQAQWNEQNAAQLGLR